MQDSTTGVRPLSGLKVLDLSQILAGPYCTRLLADAGAEVTKIEPPTGDPSRNLPAMIGENHSGYFLWLNAGKRSVVADLRSQEGRNLILALAAEADVLVENMRPGSLNDKGLGYEQLRLVNPGLVMCSISAFGGTGAFAGRAGQGIVAEGWAGVIDMNGYPGQTPLPLGVALADVSAGIHAYGAILTALYRRDHVDGIGEYIDISLFDASLPFHETAIEEVEFGDAEPTRNGSEHRAVVPYGVYEAPDAPLVIAAGTERLWKRLDEVLGERLGPADVDLSTNELRLRHRQIVKDRIEKWAGLQGSRDRALEQLTRAGIPCGPVVAVKDVARGELATSRGTFATIPDAVLGQVSVLGTPYKTTNSLIGPTGPAPALGEHTEQVVAAVLDRGSRRE
ncbi:CaiB/BaiF CoA transferase family protein [Leifsonella bigeumensis]|uniref:CaiB/BaiF CoA transferase family protein n=1 Tax=Leifsonella bigeumensis TaxID=433643 RepID=UPI0031D1AFFB